MAIKDILLTLVSHPDPTPTPVIDSAVSIAATLGAHLAAVTCETRMQIPGSFLAPPLANIKTMVAQEANRSLQNAKTLLADFEAAANKQDISHEKILDRAFSFELADLFTEYARLRDLTIVSAPPSYDQWHAETVIFGSGRPVIVLPEDNSPRDFKLSTVVIAWDFSRAAARAVADAIPILEKTRHVRIVTALGEKEIDTNRSGDELAKNLSRHGVEVTLETIKTAGKPIGNVIETYVLRHKADLLVMGAYGHSRLREFVLGGATKSLLAKPPVPVLLSH